MKNLKRMVDAYKKLLGIMTKNAPITVILVFVLSILAGVVIPISTKVNIEILNRSLAATSGEKSFTDMIPLLILFLVLAILPNIINLYIFGIAEENTLLVLRSVFRGEMLKKLKTMKYEHLENEASMEIIGKAYSRAENSARHLFPMYIMLMISSVAGASGSIIIIVSIKWWLIFPLLIPFFIETFMANKSNYNIYLELESYWKKEKEYGILADFLKNRNYIVESRLNQSSDYLVDVYEKRFNTRNKEYEKYFFKNLKKLFVSSNIANFGILGNVIILLFLFIYGQIDIGVFISVSLLIFNSFYGLLHSLSAVFKYGHYHINFFDYYLKYFDLSEDEIVDNSEFPKDYSIEFKDCWFRYPGTHKDVLRGLSFRIENGEKISIVGKNGEGKTTMVKLLLGLFTPDKGEILIGGKPLASISNEEKCKVFGTVFQDFTHFNITLRENIVLGDLRLKDDIERLKSTMKKTKVLNFSDKLTDKEDTLLGREFDGGVDLSGGQWQRVAMARAFFGEKNILILDEPTSQLDPMAESELYTEFAELSNAKTTLLITHRLGATAITDRIIVISDGVVSESGKHEELLLTNGLYSQMFEEQKSWYNHDNKEAEINV